MTAGSAQPIKRHQTRSGWGLGTRLPGYIYMFPYRTVPVRTRTRTCTRTVPVRTVRTYVRAYPELLRTTRLRHHSDREVYEPVWFNKESNVESSLLWLSFQLLGLQATAKRNKSESSAGIPTEKLFMR